MTSVSFDTPDAGPGVEVVDAIERRRFALETTGPVRPGDADPAAFPFPVDAAVAVETQALTVPTVVPVYVRDAEGRMVVEVEHDDEAALPADEYVVEVCGPVKLYLAVAGPVTVASSRERTRIRFDGVRRVRVGARSYHDRPAATVTTTPAPADVMAAVSTFGSALKTTSPERSFPTLRGHPPAVEVGEELSIPPGLDPPDTGVTVRCPRDLGTVFAVAPLAYYLGARVEPGAAAELRTDDGLTYPLDGPDGDPETAAGRVLRRTLFLDCVVRTEGLYDVPLHERAAVEGLDLDLAALYDASLAERLAAYLDVPHEAVADALPAWKLTAYLDPAPAGAELLPYLVDDLALVRRPAEQPLRDSAVGRAVADELLFADGAVRSGGSEAPDAAPVLRPAESPSMAQAWAADGVPVGASKLTAAACRNRLARRPAVGDYEVAVVCTDDGMAAERDAVEAVYGSRADLPFEVTIHRDPTVEELAAVLADDAALLHFVGHVDADGVACADGHLDLRRLASVGVDAFLLNGCRSYVQGLALVEAGAVGGIVTVSDVVDAGAVELGGTLARLLEHGFSLRAALAVLRETDRRGASYVAVGDGGVAFAQPENGTPVVCDVRRRGAGADEGRAGANGDRAEPADVATTTDGDAGFVVDVTAYPTKEGDVGSLFVPYLADNDTHYLAAGHLDSFAVTRAELRTFLAQADVPVRVDGRLHWSSDLSVEAL